MQFADRDLRLLRDPQACGIGEAQQELHPRRACVVGWETAAKLRRNFHSASVKLRATFMRPCPADLGLGNGANGL